MSSRNCAFLDRTDIIGRSGFRGAYWWATSKPSPDPSTNGKARPAATGGASDSNRQLALPATMPSAEMAGPTGRLTTVVQSSAEH
jgi:hypothetical protein